MDRLSQINGLGEHIRFLLKTIKKNNTDPQSSVTLQFYVTCNVIFLLNFVINLNFILYRSACIQKRSASDVFCLSTCYISKETLPHSPVLLY